MTEADRYKCESILVHEFAHMVMDVGLHEHPLRVRRGAAGVGRVGKGLGAPDGRHCGSLAGRQQRSNSTLLTILCRTPSSRPTARPTTVAPMT